MIVAGVSGWRRLIGSAYPRFKWVVSARELMEAFTPPSDEVERARAKTTTEQHFLVLVVLLKCSQRLGYFPKLAERKTRQLADRSRVCRQTACYPYPIMRLDLDGP